MSADANTASIEVSSFLQKLLHFPSEFFVAKMIPVKNAPPSKYRALAGRIHSNVAVRGLLSALIVCQFAVEGCFFLMMVWTIAMLMMLALMIARALVATAIAILIARPAWDDGQLQLEVLPVVQVEHVGGSEW
jgi:hypothetical protein